MGVDHNTMAGLSPLADLPVRQKDNFEVLPEMLFDPKLAVGEGLVLPQLDFCKFRYP